MALTPQRCGACYVVLKSQAPAARRDHDPPIGFFVPKAPHLADAGLDLRRPMRNRQLGKVAWTARPGLKTINSVPSSGCEPANPVPLFV
jgi:hypothetical protein